MSGGLAFMPGIAPFRIGPAACAHYVERIFAMKAAGLTFEQAMKGWDYRHNLSGDAAFEAMLEQFAEPLSAHVGKRLIPTYSFGRLYQRGDVLNAHRDRPSCEFSLTMTLGFSGDQPWPICTSPDPVGAVKQATVWHIPPGAALAYPGCDVTHWREPLEMEWQAQMFFHYVDADGPHAALKFDGRGGLAHHCCGDCNGCALPR